LAIHLATGFDECIPDGVFIGAQPGGVKITAQWRSAFGCNYIAIGMLPAA